MKDHVKVKMMESMMGAMMPVMNRMSEMQDPVAHDASLLFNMGQGNLIPYEYGGVDYEIEGYQTAAWIGTTLMISPVYDVYGPEVIEFMNSVCVNDFSKLNMEGLRHAVLCNDKGYILNDGVAIKVKEDRIRTYWLNPVLEYYVKNTKFKVKGEDMSGKEYFIQIDGEKSLEILEDAFEQDLHDIKFAKHRFIKYKGRTVNVIRLGMSGNLAYEIHGDMKDYEYIYKRVWHAGEKYGARKLGMHAYNLFNHTEAGFPNINLHYPLPWFETSDGLTLHMYKHPMAAMYNIARHLSGSVGDELETRFMTPYDVGWGFLVKFNHDFIGREALEKVAKNPPRTVTTLLWNADDIAEVFATRFRPGEEPAENIALEFDLAAAKATFNQQYEYRADKVFAGKKEIGITTGRIQSYTYNAMISLGFIDPKYAKEGTELTILWGTPGTRQMKVRATVAPYPFNKDWVRNEDKDVSDIPRKHK